MRHVENPSKHDTHYKITKTAQMQKKLIHFLSFYPPILLPSLSSNYTKTQYKNQGERTDLVQI